MKGTLAMLLLTSFVLAENEKIKIELKDPKKKKGLSNENLPEDIKEANEFLKKSKEDFDQVQQVSAVKALQNSVMSQAMDLSIPKLENDLGDENLPPVRQLAEGDGDEGEGDEEKNEEMDEDKLDDVEKRLFSIEDKVDHLLLHAGHDLTRHHLVMTPWGTHLSPSEHNPDSMNHKLRMVDYMFGNMPAMGGHMMGMGGHMMGMGGHMMGMGGHMMGIGHMNPMRHGLDHHAAMKFGMYPYHALNVLHPLHTWAPYGMYHDSYSMYGYHPIYGYLGHGMMSHSRYGDELAEERHNRFMRHQRDMDEILNKPIMPPLPKPSSTSSSSSLFLI